MLRRWISLAIMIALVVTTMPSIAYASMNHDLGAKAEYTQVQQEKGHGDCHGHDDGQASVKKTSVKQTDSKPGKNSCCDKVCKCINGSCHGGTIVLGLNSFSHFYSPVVAKNSFGNAQDILDSAIADRIKRPPRI